MMWVETIINGVLYGDVSAPNFAQYVIEAGDGDDRVFVTGGATTRDGTRKRSCQSGGCARYSVQAARGRPHLE